MVKRYVAKERDRLIETVRASGEPVKGGAKRLGVKESTVYYYWMKRARRAEPPKFARVIPTARTSKTSVSIDVGGVVIRADAGFDAAFAARIGRCVEGRAEMIAHGPPVYVALEPVDMRFGYERLGGIVRERMQAEPRSRALFVFVDHNGYCLLCKRPHRARFKIPDARSIDAKRLAWILRGVET